MYSAPALLPAFSILDGHRKPFQSVVAIACHCFKTCKAGDANLGLPCEAQCLPLFCDLCRMKQRNRLCGAIEWAMSDSREAMTCNSLGCKSEVIESTEILSRDATTGVHGAGKRNSKWSDFALRKERLPSRAIMSCSRSATNAEPNHSATRISCRLLISGPSYLWAVDLVARGLAPWVHSAFALRKCGHFLTHRSREPLR